jgi:hypothetical protein
VGLTFLKKPSTASEGDQGVVKDAAVGLKNDMETISEYHVYTNDDDDDDDEGCDGDTGYD